MTTAFRLGSYALLLSTFFLSHASAQAPEAAYNPGLTSVAVLPIANMTGLENGPEIKGLKKEVYEEACRQFGGRGFKLITPKSIDEALARLNIDLEDVEQQKRAVLRSIGQAVGADLIVFVAVTDLKSTATWAGVFSGTSGLGKVKCWLLESNSERFLMSGKVEMGQSDAGTPYVLGQTSRSIHATVLAVKNAFDRVLKAYPHKKESK